MKHQPSASNGSRTLRAKRPPLAAATSAGASGAFEPDSSEGRDAFIRSLAYASYEARGRVDGHELEDWLQAEAQFEASHRQSADAGAAGH